MSLARAILHNPDLILLDEPSLGLDPQFARFIRQFIKDELNQKVHVVVLDFDENKKRISLGLKQLQPHPWDVAGANIKEGDIVKGKIVNVKTPEQYKRDIPHTEVLEIRLQGQPYTAPIQTLPGVERVASGFKDGVTTLKVVAKRAEAVLSEAIEHLRQGGRILGIDIKQHDRFMRS